MVEWTKSGKNMGRWKSIMPNFSFKAYYGCHPELKGKSVYLVHGSGGILCGPHDVE